MKRFQFPLERVRQYRRLQLEAEHARLEDLLARLRSLDQLEAELKRQRLQAERALFAPGAAVAGQELTRFAEFRDYTDRVAVMLEQRRAITRTAIAAQRQTLLVARQRWEMLDRLKEHAHTKWNHAFQKEQENLAAELFLVKWGRGA